jgi:hypothetical protein
MVADIAVKLTELLCEHIKDQSFVFINLGLNYETNEIVVFYDDKLLVSKSEQDQIAVS